MSSSRALKVYQSDAGVDARLESVPLAEIGSGEVLIRARYSSLNYKDALAVTGKGRILRHYPLIAGIDVAGEVAESGDPRFSSGDAVLVTGCGLGEEHDGGFSEYVRVPIEWVIPLPAGYDARQAMILGTAGFTAALALTRMEQAGQTPAHGPVLVTGASGGVGRIAVDILAGAGYRVSALSGKPEQHALLRELGAEQVITPEELKLSDKPLAGAAWGGVIDNVGGEMLSGLLPQIAPWGSVASIGLAGGIQLSGTVMPFILRGVSLLGINSSGCPQPLRRRVWERLAGELKPRHLTRIVEREIPLDEVLATSEDLLARRISGRTLVAL
ncbi:YhdH/YhfP family quinone oxidoreductase [Alkalilimnicola sp. S0819]|uniref:YhdH/YhfP family quinone oxidoreductase n=1 Tax=Alkalilimnicola sp. S0819 TaxID=2613922 RepID=UPI0012629756|nr:YhdH/YhfP family quinone oxidoreductase [Alkalilimnicola sp. S0819]KAB7627266.1 YhdH/YhfP family quinone oxidoreductase [Alkalilimnicola sp. S0819]MPQ15979.1 acryloyl-CoA reductase [Alkalilimnicola sp. S0819]